MLLKAQMILLNLKNNHRKTKNDFMQLALKSYVQKLKFMKIHAIHHPYIKVANNEDSL